MGRRLQAAAATLVVVAAAAAVLALAGVFSSDDDGTPGSAGLDAPAGEPSPQEPSPRGDSEPRLSTVRVGGRPTAVAASREGVWVADSFSPRAAVLGSEAADAKALHLTLRGAAPDVAVSQSGAWYALPEQQALERRELDDPEARGQLVGLDGFPNAVAAAEDSVWALSESNVESIDIEGNEVADRFDVGGFASSLAAGEGALWVVVDNRQVVRIDPGSGERRGEPVEAPDAFNVATGEGGVWVLSASGALTRIDPGSLEVTTAPGRVRGALDVAAGHGAVWVTSSNRTVSRLDPDALEPVGKPLDVGDEPASVSVGSDAVWVANGGDGTLTRIEP